MQKDKKATLVANPRLTSFSVPDSLQLKILLPSDPYLYLRFTYSHILITVAIQRKALIKWMNFIAS